MVGHIFSLQETNTKPQDYLPLRTTMPAEVVHIALQLKLQVWARAGTVDDRRSCR
jgi:hypothetical protein